MKKIILTSIYSLLLAVVFTGCSSDANSPQDFNNEEANSATLEDENRGAHWNGVIGIAQNGTFEITADATLLKRDLEDILKMQGYGTTLTGLEIVEKTASNDPSNIGYFLVGSNGAGTSIGVLLARESNTFVLDKSSIVKAISCRGCHDGCNLSYVTMAGKKVAYCNENGCVYHCEKNESSF